MSEEAHAQDVQEVMDHPDDQDNLPVDASREGHHPHSQDGAPGAPADSHEMHGSMQPSH